MENWEIFENDCVDFLNNTYGSDDVKFVGKGKSNSTISDIEVIINKKSTFFIETKMPKAQSGQFVLLIEGNKFIYSPRNKEVENDYTNFIKDYINANFNFYENVNTSALAINLPDSYFAKWIKGHYINKGVKYVITSYKKKFIIFPINKYDDYFNVTANFRRKSSGSQPWPKKYFNNTEEYFKKDLSNEVCLTQKNNKTFLESSNDLNKHQYSISDINCQLSLKAENMYEIRKLGKTKNPNVIFSVNCIKSQDRSDLDCFVKLLK